MKTRNTWIRMSLFIALTVAFAAPAFGEAFIDLYAGPSYHVDSTVRISSREADVRSDEQFDNNLTYGFRSGYWFRNQPWLGIAGDVSTMHAKSSNVQFDLVPATVLAMFRLPLLADEQMPQGRLQPYVGLGPSVSLYTYGSGNLGEPTNGISGWGFDYGYQIPAGIAVPISKSIALFGEYRYANYRVDVDQNAWEKFFSEVGGDRDEVAREIEARLQIHNVLFGVSLRF